VIHSFHKFINFFDGINAIIGITSLNRLQKNSPLFYANLLFPSSCVYIKQRANAALTAIITKNVSVFLLAGFAPVTIILP
jgi:hypothetical protein